jgi:hypothetical protein
VYSHYFTYRVVALVAVLLGIYCNVVAIRSCDFLQYNIDSDSVTELPFPFDGVGAQGHVGLFGYRPVVAGLENDNQDESSSDRSSFQLPWKLDHSQCITYYDKFFQSSNDNIADNGVGWQFGVAQLSAICALVMAVLGLSAFIIDWLAWTSCLSYTLNWMFFLLASLFQGATYFVYGQREFWYVNVHDDVYRFGGESCRCGVYRVGWYRFFRLSIIVD